MALIELVSSDIKQAIDRFEQFHQRFAQYFATKTRTMAHTAKQYMQGQLQYERIMQVFFCKMCFPEVLSMFHWLSDSHLI